VDKNLHPNEPLQHSNNQVCAAIEFTQREANVPFDIEVAVAPGND